MERERCAQRLESALGHLLLFLGGMVLAFSSGKKYTLQRFFPSGPVPKPVRRMPDKVRSPPFLYFPDKIGPQ